MVAGNCDVLCAITSSPTGRGENKPASSIRTSGIWKNGCVLECGTTIFFQLVSARYERGSIILTSNKSYGDWGSIFGDSIIATAILDRLLQDAQWRFYRPLVSALDAGDGAGVRLPEGDATSRDYLAAALKRWNADGTLDRARIARGGNLRLEIAQLRDGLVCHS